jgi:hypothetical protein
MLVEFLKGNHFAIEKATALWLWGSRGLMHCKGEGVRPVQVSAMTRGGVPRPGCPSNQTPVLIPDLSGPGMLARDRLKQAQPQSSAGGLSRGGTTEFQLVKAPVQVAQDRIDAGGVSTIGASDGCSKLGFSDPGKWLQRDGGSDASMSFSFF